ncbi:universal stress protein [Portibacter lacus]|uniref:Universal stress protein UspA n=1 Tax=Portibacter lacus TaxID=1099794 RepID=A0AA37SPN0_9BACT|nr:universal stress protein [Portibacter lacus]GLR17665.1 universal stress protein UspA [Portibacter lacus]
MKTILALIDVDAKATEILDTAFRFAKQNDAKLIVYHHLFKEESISIRPSEFAINSDTSISKSGQTYQETYNLVPEYRFTSGKFKHQILDCVKKENVDLIVMGSNGVSNAKERILGSHAEKVLESAECSVLILKDLRLNHPLKEVVFASSFNKKDREIFTYFLEFLKLPSDCLIHLLMVDTYSFFNQPSILVQESLEEFEELAKPYRTESHFFHGISIEDGILKFMGQMKPDLLVMSNKYSRILRTSLSGSKMIATIHQNEHPFLNIDYDSSKKEA